MCKNVTDDREMTDHFKEKWVPSYKLALESEKNDFTYKL